jgi:hypothetical protein
MRSHESKNHDVKLPKVNTLLTFRFLENDRLPTIHAGQMLAARGKLVDKLLGQFAF